MFEWNATPRPIVALAPMAGVTDASYRQFIKHIEPGVIVYTEFLSTDALCYGSEKTKSLLKFDPERERPFIVQIFGNNREHFIAACKIIEQAGADGIDINMGCPAAKVVSSCFGSALIRRADLAASLVDAAVRAVSIPVSVKTRLGWEDSSALIAFCTKLEEAGAKALTIHGRTYKQKFTGNADWEPIYELKRQVHIPVIGNGDIRSAQEAVDKLGNLDGVMVGRGTMGNPWLLKEIMDSLRLRRHPSTLTEVSQSMSLREKVPFILMHCKLAVEHKGEKYGIREMRKHFVGYVKGFDGAKDLRKQLLETQRFDEVENILTAVS